MGKTFNNLTQEELAQVKNCFELITCYENMNISIRSQLREHKTKIYYGVHNLAHTPAEAQRTLENNEAVIEKYKRKLDEIYGG